MCAAAVAAAVAAAPEWSFSENVKTLHIARALSSHSSLTLTPPLYHFLTLTLSPTSNVRSGFYGFRGVLFGSSLLT